MKTLSDRMELEKELQTLVEKGPIPSQLSYEEILEVVHCLSIENKRLRCQVDHLEAEIKMWCSK